MRTDGGMIMKWLVINIDVDARKRTEQSLSDAEELLRAFVMTKSGIIYLMNTN